MEPATTTQLITVVGTLGGVMLTLAANSYLERRRARDTRELESLRVATEQRKWLRDERLNAYATMSGEGEETLHFIRNELPPLLGVDGSDSVDETESRWRERRTELRKAHNRVQLVGTPEATAASREIWRAARNGANDFFGALRAGPPAGDRHDLHELIVATVARLGNTGDRFMEACREDLQSTQ